MFPLDKNLGELREFYNESKRMYQEIENSFVHSLSGHGYTEIAIRAVIEDPNMRDRKLRNEKYLPKATAILMCSLWDEFKKYLKKNENSRYIAKFTAGYELYYNDRVKEIFLVRNCLVHRAGLVDVSEDSELIALNSKYKAGDTICLSDQDINMFFREILSAFTQI